MCAEFDGVHGIGMVMLVFSFLDVLYFCCGYPEQLFHANKIEIRA